MRLISEIEKLDDLQHTKEERMNMSIKKFLMMVLAVVILGTMVGCQGSKTEETNEDAITGGEVQIPNPWVETTDLEEAQKAVDFEFTPIELPEGYENQVYVYMREEADRDRIRQFAYKGDERLLYEVRKEGTDSGDYSSYTKVETETVEGVEITYSYKEDVIVKASTVENGFIKEIMMDEGMTEEFVRTLW